ncbi:3'-5' exonuclease for RNA 3' ss-tail [Schizosaccharomyces octosporus yFS286]|uniref:3'-5' exonuclease for RNA 3' ss-tail n=1 Tax=Schizosaccharomyces octosporus (strain yFS286) TaxID=483514 RepID=S9PP15_SCHOY|nr:3'-5' exonuclease for RNA 3' ss-tail [Schizosaccharomyces octosporus yFS286]EPX70981.1 3'-5' exonuclease for RNA 3' ss-tail [Schizosaccharomyces octosporus yFS286]
MLPIWMKKQAQLVRSLPFIPRGTILLMLLKPSFSLRNGSFVGFCSTLPPSRGSVNDFSYLKRYTHRWCNRVRREPHQIRNAITILKKNSFSSFSFTREKTDGLKSTSNDSIPTAVNVDQLLLELERKKKISVPIKDVLQNSLDFTKRAHIFYDTESSNTLEGQEKEESDLIQDQATPEISHPFEYGDLLVLAHTTGLEIGIYVGTNPKNHANLITTITEDGDMSFNRIPRVLLRFPKFIEEFHRYCRKKKLNGQLRIPPNYLEMITRSLKRINKEIQETCFNNLVKYNEIYPTLRAREPMPFHVTFAELLKIVYKDQTPSISEKIALLTYLATRNRHFVVLDHLFSEIQTVFLNPLYVDPTFEDVLHTIRIKSPAYFTFLRKARQLIQNEGSKTLPSSPKTIRPIPLRSFIWDDYEKKIINFIKYQTIMCNLQKVPHPLLSDIYKDLGLYDYTKDFSANDFHKLLCDIGVWSPWTLSRLLAPEAQIAFPQLHYKTRKKYEEDYEHFSDPSHSVSKDVLEDLRTDLTHLNCFAIDSSSTLEVDDAISIEKKRKGFWLHIHIANPSSMIDLNSPLMAFAERNFQTLYLTHIEKKFMLPLGLTKQLWTLDGSDRQRALTFSAKLSKNGEVLDYKVQPSWISRVKRYTYSQVCAALNEKENLTVYSSVQSRNLAKEPEIPADDRQAIFSILEEVKKFTRLKQKNNSFMFQQPSLSVDLLPEKIPETMISGTNPVYWSSFPSISLTINHSGMNVAELLVSECMILAGHISAKFFSEHRIPGIYRGQNIPFSFDNSFNEHFDKLLRARDEWGKVPLEQMYPISPYLTSSYMSTKGAPHFSLGINSGYMQSTSPLRRYTDLINHYQMQCLFLKDKSKLITQEQIEKNLPYYSIKEKLIKYTSRYTERFWALEFLARLPKDKLPLCHGIINNEGQPTVILEEFGLKAQITTANLDLDLDKCHLTRKAVRIMLVQPFQNQLFVSIVEE